MLDDNNIKWFKDIKDSEITEIGYKAHRLSELHKSHFPIPRGFVINSKYYFSFFQQNDLKEKILEILKTINIDNKEEILKKSKQIKDLIYKTKFKEKFINEIAKMYNKIGESQIGWLNSKVDEYVAIRVSIVSEKHPPKELDFIEKYSGFLNIKGINQIMECIKEIWASSFDPELIIEKNKKNISDNDFAIAIIIQKMINAPISGIMKTTNDIGEKNTIIEAIYGFGGSGIICQITPDNYEVNKKNIEIIRKTQSKQEWMLKRIVGKTTKVIIDENKKNKPKLENHDIKELTSIGKKLELFFGNPLYVDWVIDKADIYILSADPIDPSKKKIIKKNTKKIEHEGFQDKMDSFKKDVIIQGIPVSPGIANGVVKIIKNKLDLEEIDSETILVSKMTSLEMTPYVKKAKAVITDAGSTICHAALISKKYDIPCIVHTEYATSKLKDGQNIQVNGNNGKVYNLTGVKIIKIKKEEEKEIKMIEKESEIPKTFTQIIVKIDEIEKLREINKEDINGIYICTQNLFTKEEYIEIIKDKEILIKKIRSKIDLIKKITDNKKIYYEINLHQKDLVYENISNYELEAIFEENNENIKIILDNIKSKEEIIPIEQNTINKIGIKIDSLNTNIIYSILENIETIIINTDNFDKSKNVEITNICKENKIKKIININKNNKKNIKEYIESKINAIIIDYNEINLKEIVYKKEQELLKDLLST
ncbi:MAG: PEP/pyruvate-binding domain-containing protein [Candidatus ainarchaeum sp.]|nr:PEP/pyruvate-binding domain-containing protein [Candidatus ainarchaeum sp.]